MLEFCHITIERWHIAPHFSLGSGQLGRLRTEGIYICSSICPALFPSVCLYVCASIHPSVCQFLFLFCLLWYKLNSSLCFLSSCFSSIYLFYPSNVEELSVFSILIILIFHRVTLDNDISLNRKVCGSKHILLWTLI